MQRNWKIGGLILVMWLGVAQALGQAAPECDSPVGIASPRWHLCQALKHYRKLARRGGWRALPTGGVLRPGDQGPRVTALRRRLLKTGELNADDVAALDDPFDDTLEDALEKFQRSHDLLVTGELNPETEHELDIPVGTRITTILSNLERWRWLPASLGRRYLLVDIAGFQVRAYENEKPVMVMRSIVGGEEKKTPLFSSRIEEVVLNPWWYIPRSIAIDEVLPALRESPKQVEGDHVEALRSEGSKLFSVDIEKTDWNKVGTDPQHFNYQFRQAPGPDNPLGSIKFVLPNAYSVYLHGTTDKGLFEASARDISHGCVRVERPLDLAQWVLHGAHFREPIAGMVKTGKERAFKVRDPVPVYFTYWTAFVDEKEGLQFRKDVYGWDDWDTQLLNAMRYGPHREIRAIAE